MLVPNEQPCPAMKPYVYQSIPPAGPRKRQTCCRSRALRWSGCRIALDKLAAEPDQPGHVVRVNDDDMEPGQEFCPYARTPGGTSDIPDPCSSVGYRKPDDEMAATGQRNRLDIQLVHHLSRDFPVASYDEIAPFQSAAATSRNGYPAQTGRPAHSGMPGFRSGSAGLPHGHDDRTNAREAR